MTQEAVHRIAVQDVAAHIEAMEAAGWVQQRREDDGDTVVFSWRYDPEGTTQLPEPAKPSEVEQSRLDDARGMTAPEGIARLERQFRITPAERLTINTESGLWDHVPGGADRSDGSWISRSVVFAWDDGRIDSNAVASSRTRVTSSKNVQSHQSLSINERPLGGQYTGSIHEYPASGPVVDQMREGETVATAWRRYQSDPPQWIVWVERNGYEESDGPWRQTDFGTVYRVFEGPPARTPYEERAARKRREQMLLNNPLTRAGLGLFGCLSTVAYVVLFLVGIGLLIALLSGAEVIGPLAFVSLVFICIYAVDRRLKRWRGVH